MTLVWASRDWSPAMVPPLFLEAGGQGHAGAVGVGVRWGRGHRGWGLTILTGNISMKVLGLNDPDLIQLTAG